VCGMLLLLLADVLRQCSECGGGDHTQQQASPSPVVVVRRPRRRRRRRRQSNAAVTRLLRHRHSRRQGQLCVTAAHSSFTPDALVAVRGVLRFPHCTARHVPHGHATQSTHTSAVDTSKCGAIRRRAAPHSAITDRVVDIE